MRGSPHLPAAALVISGVAYFAAPARAQDEPRKHVDAAARFGVIGSTGFLGFGVLFGAEAAYIITPPWRMGGYFEWAGVQTPSSDRAIIYDEHFEAYRFGVRGQWHARPARAVDPWIGASFGPFVTTDLELFRKYGANVTAGRWGVDIGFDAGIDFHLGIFTFGPVFMLVVPFGPVQQVEREPRVAASPATPVGAYLAWPLLLRVGATF